MQFPTFRAGRKGMLRRIPVTPLVYLAILLPTLFVAASWAATPDESMEILLKPSPTSSSPMPAVNEAKPRYSKRAKHAVAYGPNVAAVYAPGPAMAYAPGPPVGCGPCPAAMFPYRPSLRSRRKPGPCSRSYRIASFPRRQWGSGI